MGSSLQRTRVPVVRTSSHPLSIFTHLVTANCLRCPEETFAQATHSSIDDFDSDDEELLSDFDGVLADDEALAPTPSILLLGPDDRENDRFEPTVRYHTVLAEAPAKKATASSKFIPTIASMRN